MRFYFVIFEKLSFLPNFQFHKIATDIPFCLFQPIKSPKKNKGNLKINLIVGKCEKIKTNLGCITGMRLNYANEIISIEGDMVTINNQTFNSIRYASKKIYYRKVTTDTIWISGFGFDVMVLKNIIRVHLEPFYMNKVSFSHIYCLYPEK